MLFCFFLFALQCHRHSDTDKNEENGKIDEKIVNFENEEEFNECILDQFRYIGGRRFHNALDVKYFLPNDIGEAERLRGQHYLYQHIWQGNFSSPVQQTLRKPGATVLDVGYLLYVTPVISFPLSYFFL